MRVLVAAEQAAPGWLPYVFLAIPVVIMLLLARWAIRTRAHSRRGRSAEPRLEAILHELAVAPENHGPRDGMPHDEGWMGTMLGLRSKISASTNVLEPHVFWGERHGRQVFVRVGPDERIEGGTTMFSNRHVRDITVVRCATPPFVGEFTPDGWRLTADAPDGAHAVIAPLENDAALWDDVVIAGGRAGLVASRHGAPGTWFPWVADLWLLERLADAIGTPLPKARVGPSWKVPYELGRKLRPDAPGEA